MRVSLLSVRDSSSSRTKTIYIPALNALVMLRASPSVSLGIVGYFVLLGQLLTPVVDALGLGGGGSNVVCCPYS